METPRNPEEPTPIIPLKDYVREADRSTERYEELPDSQFAALVLSMWAHPARSDMMTLQSAAEGSIGRHPLQQRLDDLLTSAIELEFDLPENDIIAAHFTHTETVVAGDDLQERATAHTKIIYAVSESELDPQHRQLQAVTILARIIHAYDEPLPPAPKLHGLNTTD